MKELSLQAFILLLCFTSVFLWEKGPYTDYTVHLIGFFSVLYVLSSRVSKKKPHDEAETHELPTIVLLLISVLLLITITGGRDSIVFFLLYFLPFYLACVLRPGIVFFFALYAFFFFFPDAQIEAGIKLYALLLFTPLAYFMGKNIRERQALQEKENALEQQNDTSSKKIMADVADIVRTEGNKLDDQTLSSLKDIVDTSKTLGKEKKV